MCGADWVAVAVAVDVLEVPTDWDLFEDLAAERDEVERVAEDVAPRSPLAVCLFVLLVGLRRVFEFDCPVGVCLALSVLIRAEDDHLGDSNGTGQDMVLNIEFICMFSTCIYICLLDVISSIILDIGETQSLFKGAVRRVRIGGILHVCVCVDVKADLRWYEQRKQQRKIWPQGL